jgi:hypothetical protein
MRSILLTLLGVLLLVSGCPGSAGPGTRARRDSGISLEPDGYVAWPTAPNPETGIGFAPGTEAGVAPVPKPDSTPPAPACTPIDGICGGAQPSCCAGGHCVDFPNLGPKCAKICTGNAECSTSCCVSTSQGVSVCGPASYCPQNNPPTEPDPTPAPTPTPTPPAPSGTSCQNACGGQAPGGVLLRLFLHRVQ